MSERLNIDSTTLEHEDPNQDEREYAAWMIQRWWQLYKRQPSDSPRGEASVVDEARSKVSRQDSASSSAAPMSRDSSIFSFVHFPTYRRRSSVASCIGDDSLPIDSQSKKSTAKVVPNKAPAIHDAGIYGAALTSPHGLMADVAAGVIQDAMRRNREKRKARQELEARRQAAAAEAAKSRTTLHNAASLAQSQRSATGDGTPLSQKSDVAPYCVANPRDTYRSPDSSNITEEPQPVAASRDVAGTSAGTVDLFNNKNGDFQSNIAAFMIQGLWRRRAQTQQDRQRFEDELRKRCLTTSVDELLSSLSDSTSAESAAKAQERVVAATMIQCAVRVRRARRSTQERRGRLDATSATAPTTAASRETHVANAVTTSAVASDEISGSTPRDAADLRAEQEHAAAIIQSGFRRHGSRAAQLQVEEAQLELLRRKEAAVGPDAHVASTSPTREFNGVATPDAAVVETSVLPTAVVVAVAGVGQEETSLTGGRSTPSNASKPPLPFGGAPRSTNTPVGGHHPRRVSDVPMAPKPSTPTQYASRNSPGAAPLLGTVGDQRPPSVLFSFRRKRSAPVKRDGLSRVLHFAHEEELTVHQPSSAMWPVPQASAAGSSSPRRRDSVAPSPTRKSASPPPPPPPPLVPVPAVTYHHHGLRVLHDAVWDMLRAHQSEQLLRASDPEYVPLHWTDAPARSLAVRERRSDTNDGTAPGVSTFEVVPESTAPSLLAGDMESSENPETSAVDHMLDEFLKTFHFIRWKSTADPVTVVVVHPPSGVEIPPLSAMPSSAPSSGAMSPMLMGSGSRRPDVLTGSVSVAGIPEETSIEAHVRHVHRRQEEEAKRIQLQRRDFRQERRQELRRNVANADDVGAAGGRGGTSGPEDQALADDMYDSAFDHIDDRALALRPDVAAVAGVHVEGVTDQVASTALLSTTEVLQEKVEAIYGPAWKYETIVPRYEPKNSRARVVGERGGAGASEVVHVEDDGQFHKRSLKKISDAKTLEAVVTAGLESLKSLNERIRFRAAQLRLSKGGGAKGHETRMRLEQLHSTIEDINHSNAGMQPVVRERDARRQRKPPHHLSQKPGAAHSSAVTSSMLPTVDFIESRRLQAQSVSPSRYREDPSLQAASAPPTLLTGAEHEEPVPMISPSQTLQHSTLYVGHRGLHGGAGKAHGGGGAGGRMTTDSSLQSLSHPGLDAVISPVYQNRSRPSPLPPPHQQHGLSHQDESDGDAHLLHNFLTEADHEAGDESRRNQWERKALREEYFESICRRHDRLQKLGGVQEAMIRRHPGWLVKGARLLPLRTTVDKPK